jgi:putative membrane protein
VTTISAHGGTAAAGLESIATLGLIGVMAMAYVVLAVASGREPRGWDHRRTAAFLTGAALLVLALVPQLSPFPDGDFRGHMYQHLLLGMYAPLALVLGAPVTLLLRSVPPAHGKTIGRVLRSRPAHVIANPVTALTLTVGGVVILYFTPLYVAAADNEVLHGLVHLHVLLSGYLFAWVIAGPDPAPDRPSVRTRLVVLGIAIAAHAVVSQLMYADLYVRVPASAEELRDAGSLMYYGGDIAELLLALALLVAFRSTKTRLVPNTSRTSGTFITHHSRPGR